MTITTNTTDRKALAKAIAEELGTTARYMGMPGCGYQVGDYVVDRDGNITGENFEALRDFLTRNGYELPDQEPPVEAQPDDELDEETPADSEAEPITQMDISIPARNATVTQLKNLIFMLHSRQTLINRMTDSDCLNIPDILIDRLQENTPGTLEDLTSLLDDSRAVAELTGFDFRDGKVSMTFPFDETQPERWTSYANLLNRIYDAAMKATRVFPERVEPDDQNEKYLAHVWLQRLGYHGADFKAERKILLGHLKGYCAFGSGDKMQAHKEKYGWLPNGKHKWFADRKQSTIWNFDKPKKSADHPTMKPIPLLAYPIKNSSAPNAVVMDLFGGSGSTLIACEQTDRICRTMELDPKYATVIVERFHLEYPDQEIMVLRDGHTISYSDVTQPT